VDENLLWNLDFTPALVRILPNRTFAKGAQYMVREPILISVAISDLRPTQITVGMHEVAAKRKRWREIAGKDTGKFLGKHMIPVVLGPKSRHYVVDHHHLARALHEEGVKDVAVTLIRQSRQTRPGRLLDGDG
jgi:hypothetical protein